MNKWKFIFGISITGLLVMVHLVRHLLIPEWTIMAGLFILIITMYKAFEL
jgi:hypothetical protein